MAKIVTSRGFRLTEDGVREFVTQFVDNMVEGLSDIAVDHGVQVKVMHDEIAETFLIHAALWAEVYGVPREKLHALLDAVLNKRDLFRRKAMGRVN